MCNVSPVHHTTAARAIVAAFFALHLVALPAASQEAAEEDRVRGLDEIVVTITKRSESVQEVAGSITAFGQEQIRQTNIESMGDLVALVPNVQQKDSGDGAISIRGISQSFTTQSPVAAHMNGIFRMTPSYMGMYDMQRIELARGPVGVNYGRNATAGAVNVIWNPPHDEFEAFGDATFGNYDLRQFRGGVNIPVFGEGDRRLMLRASLQRVVRDGWIDNQLQPKNRDAGSADDWRGRISLRSEPTEDFAITLRGRFANSDDALTTAKLFGDEYPVGTINFPGIGQLRFDAYDGLELFRQDILDSPFVGAVIFHQIVNAFPTQEAALDDILLNGCPCAPQLIPEVPTLIRGPEYLSPALPNPLGDLRLNSRAFELGGFSRRYSLEGQIDYSFHGLPLLGDVDLVLTGAWERARSNLVSDADGSDLAILDTSSPSHSTFYTGELRLVSQNEGPFDWIAGFFYFKFDDDLTQATLIPFGTFGFERTREQSGLAPFLSLTYTLEPGFIPGELELFAGVRWNRDMISVHQLNLPNALQPEAELKDKEKFRERTEELGFKWFFAEDQMFYLKWAHGYKAGLLELLISDGLPNPVTPELVDAWEAGTKSTFLDGTLLFNFTGFYYEYTDLQVPFIVGTQIITQNAAEATVWGLEAELSWQVTPDWLVRASAGHLDATFDEFCADDPLIQTTTSDSTCPQPLDAAGNKVPGTGLADLSGNTLEDSPDWKASLVSTYSHDLPEGWGNLVGVLEFTWTDEYPLRPFNLDIDTVDAFTKTDLRLIWTDENERYSVELFVENLEDEIIWQRSIVVELSGSAAGFGLAPPRTYGVRVGFHWK